MNMKFRASLVTKKTDNTENVAFYPLLLCIIFLVNYAYQLNNLPSLLDRISTASNFKSDNGLRSWLEFLNSDSKDFACGVYINMK